MADGFGILVVTRILGDSPKESPQTGVGVRFRPDCNYRVIGAPDYGPVDVLADSDITGSRVWRKIDDMRWLSPVLAALISLPPMGAAVSQDAPKLSIVIVEGDGAINNIRQRTAREPIVEVQDENHKPVAGAAVLFALPQQGAGGTFAGGGNTLTVVTNDQGRAVARGFHPNHAQGQYQMHVTASKGGQSANTNISMSNAAVAGAGAAAGMAVGTKILIVVAVAGAAAAGGAYYATHNSSGGTNSANIPAGITITPGAGTVGPPH